MKKQLEAHANQLLEILADCDKTAWTNSETHEAVSDSIRAAVTALEEGITALNQNTSTEIFEIRLDGHNDRAGFVETEAAFIDCTVLHEGTRAVSFRYTISDDDHPNETLAITSTHGDQLYTQPYFTVPMHCAAAALSHIFKSFALADEEFYSGLWANGNLQFEVTF